MSDRAQVVALVAFIALFTVMAIVLIESELLARTSMRSTPQQFAVGDADLSLVRNGDIVALKLPVHWAAKSEECSQSGSTNCLDSSLIGNGKDRTTVVRREGAFDCCFQNVALQAERLGRLKVGGDISSLLGAVWYEGGIDWDRRLEMNGYLLSPRKSRQEPVSRPTSLDNEGLYRNAERVEFRFADLDDRPFVRLWWVVSNPDPKRHHGDYGDERNEAPRSLTHSNLHGMREDSLRFQPVAVKGVT